MVQSSYNEITTNGAIFLGIFTRSMPAFKTKLSESETQITHVLELEENQLKITAHDGSIRTLAYDKITDIAYTSSVDELRASKSPIGRAVVGGVIFGGIGALVGAASGIGDKTQNMVRWHLVIAYGDAGVLAFTDYAIISNSSKFYIEFKRRVFGEQAGKVTQL